MDPRLAPDALDLTALHQFLCVCAFVLGMVWGSFFNVCIFRIPAKKSIVNPPSHCGTCGTALRPWQNVPVLGWVFLRGRCGFCGQKYGLRYPLVEFLTGLLFLLIYVQTGPTALLGLNVLLASLLVVGIFTDLDHFILPDRVTLGGAAAMIALSPLGGRQSPAAQDLTFVVDQVAFWGSMSLDVHTDRLAPWLHGLAGAVSGAAVGYGLLWGVAVLGELLFRKEAMGRGDIKLFALIGASLGVVNTYLVLFLASVIGLVVTVTFMVLRLMLDRGEKAEEVEVRPWDGAEGEAPVVVKLDRVPSQRLRELPFGPYIAVAALLILVFQADVRALVHHPVSASAEAMSRRKPKPVLPGVEIPAIRLVRAE